MAPKKNAGEKAPKKKAPKKTTARKTVKPIEQYEHKDKKRLNNPPVGLVTPETDKDGQKKIYAYDPHLDPQLQWAGKAEHASFKVDTVSLHVHERIDPSKIIETVKKEEKGPKQLSLFEVDNKPLRQALEFYKHEKGWTNRLIAGDSLLVMNSLLEKEGLGGKVQMVYFDPPYGIKYKSNFQPFVSKRDVSSSDKDEDLTAEPEMIKAFRDTWELGIHSYLAYLRDRLLLAKALLHESGSVFVQISDENVHHVREIMDEVFGVDNFIALIPFRKKAMPLGAKLLENMYDYLVWYSKDKPQVKYRQLFMFDDGTNTRWDQIEMSDGSIRATNKEEKLNPNLTPKGSRLFNPFPIQAPSYDENSVYPIEWEGKKYWPPKGTCWITSDKQKLLSLLKMGKLFPYGESLAYKQYNADFPYRKLTNIWNDTRLTGKIFVVQTSVSIIQRCLLMTTDPGDLTLDITCGSGTTAYVAEQWGRRWITCDTSRVAITLAKQRLMTANFDYYELAYPDEGVGSGFVYKTVPHITLKSIANNEPPAQETLYDQPLIDTKKSRVTGPFTVEAVPAPVAKSIEEVDADQQVSDESVTRSGETLRQSEWREELLRAGVRAKGGKTIEFSRVEPFSGTYYLQAEAETKEATPKKVLISFGPEHAPLEQRQVEEAWRESRNFKPDILLFAAFQFDEEASKDIDELTPEIAGMQLLKAQMNADLLTDDLKKKRASNESFWLIGQPDIKIAEIKKGEDKGKFQVEVLGFDYYDPRTGNVESGGKANIAMWMLDTDYDERSMFPRQVFFPLAGAQDGWAKLAKNLKAEIDEEKIEAFRGTISLPFEKTEKIAVKIIDDRGIESLRVMRLP